MYSRIRILIPLAVALFACSTVAAQPTLYWSDETANKIQRLDLAQSIVEDVVVGTLAHPSNMALDFERGHMYWSSTGRNMVLRANIDGSDIRQIVAGQLVDLEAGSNKMYVVRDSTLHRTNLDGTHDEVLLQMPGLIGLGSKLPPVAIDFAAEKVYWPSRVHWDILRANLDGTEQEVFLDVGIAYVGLFPCTR